MDKIDFTQPKYIKYYFCETLGVSLEDYDEMVNTKSDMLKKIWFDGNCKDFAVYSHKDYIWDMAKCYKNRARPTIGQMIRLIDMDEVDSILDYYNGFGVSSLHLKSMFPDKEVAFFNDMQDQIDFRKAYAKRYSINVDVVPMEEKKYDIVLLSEVFEHFEDPETFFIEKIKPRLGKYLAHASPFSDVNIGHFPKYNGIEAKKYTRNFHNFLESQGLEFVVHGFNNLPRIYKI